MSTAGMMHAELRSLHSPDLDDLAAYSPSGDFAFLLELLIGPKDSPGEEMFSAVVSTPGALAGADVPCLIRGRVLVKRFDHRELVSFLTKTINKTSGSSWNEIALKLARYFYYEFDDYREYLSP